MFTCFVNGKSLAIKARERLGSSWLFAFVISGFAATGCGDSENTKSQPSLIGNYGIPVQGCEQFSTDACEITEPSCQQAIFGLVKCIRQTPNGTLPPVTTITTAQYLDSLTQGSRDADPVSLKKLETALVMLGLASPGDLEVSNQVNVLVNTVSAYYTSDEKKVCVIRPDVAPTAAENHQQVLTLAHEFMHALQDENYDLNQFSKVNDVTYDATLAASSVVEGEAILYETMLRAAFDGLTPDQVSYSARFANAAAYVLTKYADDSPYLIAPRMFTYFYGGPYVYLELLAQGRSGVDALFANPPPATLPFIVSQDSLVETVLSPVTESGPAPVAGSALASEDTLGAWLTYQYLNRISGNLLTPQQAVSGWRGDHLWIYSDADSTQVSNIAVVWRVRLSSADEVSNFINKTNAALPGFPAATGAQRIAFSLNGDAVVVAVTGAFVLSQWQAAVTSTAASASSGPSAAGASGAAAASYPLGRALLKPVPRRVP